MRRAGLIPLSLLLTILVSPAPAQVQLGGEVGVSQLRQTGFRETGASTLGVNLDAFGRHSIVRASGLTTLGANDSWTGQALGAASLFGPIAPCFEWELAGTATTFAQNERQTAYSAELMSRLHGTYANFGGALGIGAGVRRADGGQQPVTHGQVVGWTTLVGNRFTAELSLFRTKTERPSTFDASFSFSYVDASVGWRRELGDVSLAATLGGRTTSTSILADGMSGAVEAVAWLTPHIAVVGGAGQAMDDVVRGIPRIRYLTVSVRLSSAERVLRRGKQRPTTGPQLVAGRERIEIRADGATRVEMMADFTDWNPVELKRAGTTWLLERTLSPGLHRLVLRIDGGDWITPANLPTASDDLGGHVALITIP